MSVKLSTREDERVTDPSTAPPRTLRVLQINKFFYLRGGSERYYFDVMDGLEGAGHTVVPFSMQHERNREGPWNRHFVSNVDFHDAGSPLAMLGRARRFVSSSEARDRLVELIRAERPDVAHLHNVAHQLTPSILDALTDEGVPIVQTLHDYKLICSSYLLFANGQPCERCRGNRHFEAVRQRCHHGSLAKSVLGFMEMSWHSARGSYGKVDRFLCPSRFMKEKCASFGVDDARLVHLPYFVPAGRYRPDPEPGSYALYVGRLSREKGVSTLLEAAGRTGLPLVVVGEGPSGADLEKRAGANVCFEGYLDGEALHDRIRGAAVVIVPSEWYENLPYSVLESFALGKPVIGSAMGGIPELVRDGETGQVFPPGDAAALAGAWQSLLTDRDRLRDLGANARALIEREFDADTHVAQLTTLYRSLGS